jgi:hypothetical protein
LSNNKFYYYLVSIWEKKIELIVEEEEEGKKKKKGNILYQINMIDTNCESYTRSEVSRLTHSTRRFNNKRRERKKSTEMIIT